jgi:deoxyribodipyrimidine photo-lyase
MPTINDARVRPVNARKENPGGDYVLYWSQIYRRLDRNHALDFAIHHANRLKKPLVVYEGLRLDYPWAFSRYHQFLLEGMRDTARRAAELGINYWPFVETPDHPAKGLVARLAAKACLVVTDDFPTYIVPGQTKSVADRADASVVAIDGNGLIPLELYGAAVSAAAHLRPRLHKLFAECWGHRAQAEPVYSATIRKAVTPPFELWKPPADLGAFIAGLPVDRTVPAVAGFEGGNTAARDALTHFVKRKLSRYGEGRNEPNDPKVNAASGLSPYLHYGHLSMQECAEKILTHAGDWDPTRINMACKNKREGFFHEDPNVNSYLDEALTWRDVGYHWHYRKLRVAGVRPLTHKTIDGESVPTYWDLASAIPAWAMKSLNDHIVDTREHLYTLQEFENGDTHDELWNAAQKELVATGKIHNYLRMLWGKKVLEWSKTPETAYAILEHLNNKYALDGRDPNSYTGILWCFGLFDRPWPPERKVFGNIRFMSSANTAKKFDLDGYYAYTRRLPSIGQVRGQT